MATRRRSSRSRTRSDKTEAADSKGATTTAKRSGGRRRRSSSARSSSSPSSSNALRPDRDGKVKIECPQCHAGYKIPAEKADTQITCAKCSRKWNPSAAKGPRTRREADHSKAIFGFIGGIVAIILIAVVINYATGDGDKPQQPQKKVEAPPDLGANTAQVQAVSAWAEAMSKALEDPKQRFALESHSDLGSLQKRYKIAKDEPYRQTRGTERTELKDKIIDALIADEDADVYDKINTVDGQITDAAMLDMTEGKVKLSVYRSGQLTPHVVIVNYSQDEDSRFRVAGWSVISRAAKILSKADREARRPAKAHEKISKPKTRKTMLGGEMVEIRESEVIPLGHLKDTPEDMRKKIDQAVNELVDLNDSRKANRAQLRLEGIGKPAVPRLLNKMYELKLKSRNDVLRINKVVKTLRLMTGQAFAFNVMDNTGKIKGQNIGATEKERLSSLKQWYAWWYGAANSKTWDTDVDTDEELFMSPEEKKAKEDKEREERKAKRAAERKKRRGK